MKQPNFRKFRNSDIRNRTLQKVQNAVNKLLIAASFKSLQILSDIGSDLATGLVPYPKVYSKVRFGTKYTSRFIGFLDVRKVQPQIIFLRPVSYQSNL